MRERAEILWLWLDHVKFGCGWRHYVAVPGRKWVYLTLIATGEHTKIAMAEFEKAKRVTLSAKLRVNSANPAKVAKRLRRNAKTYGIESAAVKDALKALREAA